jgi:hypothetical protein
MGRACGTYGGQDRFIQGFCKRPDGNTTWTTEGQMKRIILKWIMKTWDGRHSLDRSGSKLGQQAGDCERGNETSGSIKCGGFLD